MEHIIFFFGFKYIKRFYMCLSTLLLDFENVGLKFHIEDVTEFSVSVQANSLHISKPLTFDQNVLFNPKIRQICARRQL